MLIVSTFISTLINWCNRIFLGFAWKDGLNNSRINDASEWLNKFICRIPYKFSWNWITTHRLIGVCVFLLIFGRFLLLAFWKEKGLKCLKLFFLILGYELYLLTAISIAVDRPLFRCSKSLVGFIHENFSTTLMYETLRIFTTLDSSLTTFCPSKWEISFTEMILLLVKKDGIVSQNFLFFMVLLDVIKFSLYKFVTLSPIQHPIWVCWMF